MMLVTILALLALGGQGSAPRSPWERVVAIDPKGIETGDDFDAALRKDKLSTAGYANWFTGRWPNVSFIGGMAMGNVSEDLEFFYEKPFKWSSRVSDYVMEGGGRRFGIRATVRTYHNEGVFPGQRSYLLTYRCDRLLEAYHPSYILVNGRRVWDAHLHPILDGEILVPFWQDKPGDPVIDFVTDLDYTPEVKGLALRMFDTQYLGAPGERVSFQGVVEGVEASPADREPRLTFGLFPTGVDYWSDKGTPIEKLVADWKPNFKPEYPTEPMWLSPFSDASPGMGAYHDFMVTYGGCNVLGAKPGPDIVRAAGSYARGMLADPSDLTGTKRALADYPNLEAEWVGQVESPLMPEGFRNMALGPKAAALLKTDKEDAGGVAGAGRIRAVAAPFPPALSSAYEYENGKDVLIYKNEESPQQNILTSMARGAGRVYGKPFGFYWPQTIYPYPSLDFKLQTCLLYYFSGGSWMGAEGEDAPSFEDGTVAEWVMPYVQALRFAMVHPARGTPVVPTAICWGEGDRWWVPYSSLGGLDTFQRSISYDHWTEKLTAEPSFVKPLPWMPTDTKEWSFEDTGHLAYFYDHVSALRGYDLLDVFFPGFGDAFTARIGGLLTGTPYGPLDFVNFDAVTPEVQQTYGLSVFLGQTALGTSARQRILDLANAGGTVVVGAEQLGEGHGLPGLIVPLRDPVEFSGTVEGALGGPAFSGKVYEMNPQEWEVMASVGERKWPLVVRRAFGTGMVYVYLGRWMGEGGPVLRPLLRQLGSLVAPLGFGPADEQLEYVAYRKGVGAWAAVFNHGAIAVGSDRVKARVEPPEPLSSKVKGPWKGEIAFRLDRLGLDGQKKYGLYEVDGIDGAKFDRVISGKETFGIRAIPFSVSKGEIRAKVVVNKRAEYLIAPVGQAHAVFFGRP